MARVEEGIAFDLKLSRAQPVMLLDATEGQIGLQQHLTHKLARVMLQQCQLLGRLERSNIVGGEAHVSARAAQG